MKFLIHKLNFLKTGKGFFTKSNILNWKASIIKGIKEANETDYIPQKIQNFNNLIIVRIFKFLGFISTSIILSSNFNLLKTYNIHNLNVEIFYIATFFSLIYLSYRLIFSFLILKRIFFAFKNKEYIVRNSPRDILASVFKAALYSVKGLGQASIGYGLFFTMAYELDEIAESHGRARVLIPALNKSIEVVGLKNKVEPTPLPLPSLKRKGRV